MIFCVCLPGIMENSVNCHGRVMELYYQISVVTLHTTTSYVCLLSADNRDVTNVSEAMAEAMSYWEAESEAIIERLRRQGRTSSIVAPPATTGAATEPTALDSVTSSAGSTTGAGSTTVSVTVATAAAAVRMTAEEGSGQRQETPMEMDNPGMWHALRCHLYVSIPLNLKKPFSRAGSSLNSAVFISKCP